MQNFKQFLKEEEKETSVYPCLEIEQETDLLIQDLTSEQTDELKSLILKRFTEIDEEYFTIKHVFASAVKSFLTLSIPIKGEIDDNLIVHMKKTIDEIVIQYTELKHMVSDIIGLYIYNKLPESTKIITHNQAVIFNNFKTLMTLKNINKHIECKKIVFNYPKNIIGNALSLLLIKNLEIISVSFGGHPPWLRIINKHLTLDKDVLECQEELITNGLKEYAKL